MGSIRDEAPKNAIATLNPFQKNTEVESILERRRDDSLIGGPPWVFFSMSPDTPWCTVAQGNKNTNVRRTCPYSAPGSRTPRTSDSFSSGTAYGTGSALKATDVTDTPVRSICSGEKKNYNTINKPESRHLPLCRSRVTEVFVPCSKYVVISRLSNRHIIRYWRNYEGIP